jgi:diaminopimelate epimerase
MSKLQFTKMQGLGNDFVVINGIAQSVKLKPEQVRAIADRHFGVGCDQLLLVGAPKTPAADFYYRIFNADGSEVEQCGNGARCFARFVRDQGLIDKDEIRVETAAGLIQLRIEADGQITVDMGRPALEPADIPFIASARAAHYPITVAGAALDISVVSMGNPHAVLVVEDTDKAPLAYLGPLLERHERFPKHANVGFMQVMARNQVRLRVFERGVGETLACGTGACAAVVAGRLRGLLNAAVKVDLRGGSLRIRWQGEDQPVIMTGPAVGVFEGWIEL